MNNVFCNPCRQYRRSNRTSLNYLTNIGSWIFPALRGLTLLIPNIRKPPHSSYSLHESRFPFTLLDSLYWKPYLCWERPSLTFQGAFLVSSQRRVNRLESDVLASIFGLFPYRTQLIDALKESYVEVCFQDRKSGTTKRHVLGDPGRRLGTGGLLLDPSGRN